MNETRDITETSWYRLEETGVEFFGEPPTFDEFQDTVLFWVKLNRLTTWVIADLARYGERVYGETYDQIQAVTGLSKGRIMNIVSVANKIPPKERRTLPFGHHATVAYMEPDQREQWLDEAESNDYTREELRQAIREKVTVPNEELEQDKPVVLDVPVRREDGSGLEKLSVYDLVVEYVRATQTGLDDRARLVYQQMERIVRNSL